jgi:hypothetical protein
MIRPPPSRPHFSGILAGRFLDVNREDISDTSSIEKPIAATAGVTITPRRGEIIW